MIVSRTGDEFVRYHGKLMIVDREELHVYGFNYTRVDLKSRSFGIVTRNKPLVQEALRLIEADTTRQEFEPMQDGTRRQPRERARAAGHIHQAHEEVAGHLRPEGHRHADAPAV